MFLSFCKGFIVKDSHKTLSEIDFKHSFRPECGAFRDEDKVFNHHM